MRVSLAVVVVVIAGIAVGAWADGLSAQGRVRRSIEGPVTREAVTRSLAIEPVEAAPAVVVSARLSEVSLMMHITFGFDSADLSRYAMRDLDAVAAALNDARLRTAQLTLEGHTDGTGSADYNLRLSRRRAEAVVAYLVRRGVAAHRLRAVGFGESQLLPDYAPSDDRQRRVEIVRSF